MKQILIIFLLVGSLYPNNLKSRNFGCVKAPGLNDRKQSHISNIGSFTIVQSRELSRQPKSDFSSCLGIFASPPLMKLRHIYLTWQEDPCRTMTITVHGIETPTELTLYYDTAPHHSKLDAYSKQCISQGAHKLKLPDKRLIYHFQLKDLQPNTPYYFTIGNKTHCFGSEHSFKTIAQDPPYLFVEGGDWENTPAATKLAQMAATYSPDAILLGGDYPSGVFGSKEFAKWDEWLDVYCRTMVTKEGHLIPMVMAIGNHEVVGGFGQPKKQAPFFYDYFCQGNTAKSYFSLPFGSYVRLFVLDSGHVERHDGEQLTWLASELEAYQDCPIKIALYHVPLFPSIRFVEKGFAYRTICRMLSLTGIESPEIRLFSHASLAGQTHWLPLFDQYNLTVAFEHHDQTLKRTKLLRAGKPHPQGTLYLGDGGWGAILQYPPIQGYFNKYFDKLQGKQQFFWLVNIEQDQITYSAISQTGNCLDKNNQKISH